MAKQTRVIRRFQLSLKGIFVIVTIAGIILGLNMQIQHSRSVCHAQQSLTDTIFIHAGKNLQKKPGFKSLEVKFRGGQMDGNGFQWNERIWADLPSDGHENVVSIKVEGGYVYLIGILHRITIHDNGSSHNRDLIEKLTQAYDENKWKYRIVTEDIDAAPSTKEATK